MKTDFVSRTEFNKIPIADFLTVSNISFLEQVQSLRHYDSRDVVPGHHEEDGERLLTVNMARNEWIDRNDRSQHGHLSDLLRYFHALPDDFDGNYAEYMQYVFNMYRYMDTLPASSPTTTVRMGMVGKELDAKIDGEVYTMMALQGISRHTVDKYCRQLKQDVELSDNSPRLSDIPPLLRETPRPEKAVLGAAFCQTNEVSNINH